LNSFIRGIIATKLPQQKICVVSGIGCTGRVAGYVNLDSFHTTHGRAIPFATGLKLGDPELHVVVVSGDGDLLAIGGNHLIHAARRNTDITVICVNNFIYGMTGGQVAPTTPHNALATTTPYGNFEQPFTVPLLAGAAGASYVARWTTFHVRELSRSIKEALLKKGFSLVEAVACCPTLYARKNRLGSGLDGMRFFRDHSVVKHGAPVSELEIGLREDIVVGKFIDIERPTLVESMAEIHLPVSTSASGE